jgi:hypothetical protein
VVFHEPRNPRLVEELQAKVREPPRLVGVYGDVAWLGSAGVREQSLANV